LYQSTGESARAKMKKVEKSFSDDSGRDFRAAFWYLVP
jgi:hypothetical protein